MQRSLYLGGVYLSAIVHLPGVRGESTDDQNTIDNAVIAHGALMGLAFAFLFPIGASIMHAFKFRGFVWFHGGWQLLAYILALAGFALGVWIAVASDQLTASNGHPIIGIVVIGMLLFQPFGGWLAHYLFQRKIRKTVVHSIHRWIGRIFVTLGVINGGLGLQLSDNTTKGEVAYGVVAGICFLIWFTSWAVDRYRERQHQGLGKPSSMSLQTNTAAHA